MKKLITDEMMLTTNSQRFGGISNHWVYLANLKAYNEGFPLGTYLHFPYDSNDLDAAYKAIYVGKQFVDKFDCPYEEYFIADYEAPFSIGEYDLPLLLAEKYKQLEEYMDYPDKVIRVIADWEGESPIIHELPDGSTDEEKLGYFLFDEGLVIIPEHLRNYVDYESIGRDYAINTSGVFADDYFIEYV